MPATSLKDQLARLTREGELYERLPDGRVRCVACGHRCLIPPGREGICRVRFNDGGVLRVPFGYVGALQLDPVEKKPFFHALPGSTALSFGMLGCDYHCGYCFTGDTMVATERGPSIFTELFASGGPVHAQSDAEMVFPESRQVVTASGRLRRLKGVVRHRYRGEMVRIEPHCLPHLSCTPDHRVYATTGPEAPPRPMPARELTREHSLAVPRQFFTEEPLSVASVLAPAATRRRLARTRDHYLVPLRGIGRHPYDGDVYNMEVEEEHSYLAGFFAVSNCQNWLTSQVLRDDRAVGPPDAVSPAELVRLALSQGAPIVTSTYNEPLITSEWAVAVFKEAKAAGLVCSYVSNGNGTPEVLDYIRPYVSLYKVDLKSFRDRAYRDLGGTLDRVLWTIRALHEQGFWLEIVTLVVPGMNDSDAELNDIARFLASVSADIPWHVTAFHPDYKMQDPPRTSVDALLRAVEIGDQAGLRFVYAGNLPGHVKNRENTYCPGCRSLLVERFGFHVQRNRLAQGHCPDCSRAIPGFWSLPSA